MPIDLGTYLRQKKSPLAGHVNDIYSAANKYRVDPRLIVAIAGGETSFGVAGQGPKRFNAWGIGPGYSYKNWSDGINGAAKLLRTGYVGKGLTSLAKIQSKWAPLAAGNDPTGLNNNWLRNISRVYSDLGGNPGNVTTGWRTDASPQKSFGVPTSQQIPNVAKTAPLIDIGEIATQNLAAIARGESATKSLQRLVDATLTNAAAQRADLPSGDQSSTRSPDKGTYTTTPTTEASGNGKVNRAIQIAKQQIGTPYVWGGTKPGGFDCSGLIEYAFEQAGIPTPGRLTTWSAMKIGKSVRGGSMQPGDWLVTNKGKHIVMYIGGGQVIAAPRRGTKVQLQPVSRFKGQIVDVRRYP